MKGINILLLIAIMLISSCNKVDCPGMRYMFRIGIGNYTGETVEVELFPRPEFMYAEGHYYSSSISSGVRSTDFSMNEDTTSVYSYQYNIFTTNDTSISPSYLISRVFDSIYCQINDSSQTMIRFYPDHADNYLQNPFKEDTIWQFFRGVTYYSDNDCENPFYVKSYKFYLDPNHIISNQ